MSQTGSSSHFRAPQERNKGLMMKRSRAAKEASLRERRRRRGGGLSPILFFYILVVVVVASRRTAAAAAKCSLSCVNGGTCINGAEEIKKQQQQQQAPNNNTTKPRVRTTQEYCQCPFGFSGPLCEIKFVVCNTMNDTCPHNGDPCQRDVDSSTGSVFYHCHCDETATQLITPYAVRVCQHAATSFCRNGRNNDKTSLGGQGSSYCYNQGKCKDEQRPGTHHAGCICTSDYTGPHCETPTDPSKQQMNSFAAGGGLNNQKQATAKYRRQKWQRRILGTISWVSFFVLITSVSFFVYHGLTTSLAAQRRQRARRRREQEQELPPYNNKQQVSVSVSAQQQQRGVTRREVDDFLREAAPERA